MKVDQIELILTKNYVGVNLSMKHVIFGDSKKVKKSRNRPIVAQRVPGGLGPQIP
jgi:hypothetical protein